MLHLLKIHGTSSKLVTKQYFAMWNFVHAVHSQPLIQRGVRKIRMENHLRQWGLLGNYIQHLKSTTTTLWKCVFCCTLKQIHWNPYNQGLRKILITNSLTVCLFLFTDQRWTRKSAKCTVRHLSLASIWAWIRSEKSRLETEYWSENRDTLVKKRNVSKKCKKY